MVVTLLVPLDVLNGPTYRPGERVTFDDALARDLINRGIAKPEEVMPIPASKSVVTPPANKQITTPKGKKGLVTA